MNRGIFKRRALYMAVASALAVPATANAVEVSVSGHVNRAILFADDGFDSDVMQSDNAQSVSRFRITGSSELGVAGMRVGVNLETAWASNTTSNVTIKGRNGNATGNDVSFDIQHSNLWFSGGWGTLTLGHAATAYDGIADASQAGPVFLAGTTNGATMGSSITFKRTGNATFNLGDGRGTTVGNAYESFAGGCQGILRYDTPALGPLTASVSVSDNESWQAGVVLDTSFAGTNIVLGGGYEDLENDVEDSGAIGISERWGVNLGVAFPQGSNFTVAYSGGGFRNGNGNNGADTLQSEGRTLYLQLGHQWGHNALAVEYGQADSDGQVAAGTVDHEATVWGIGFTHALSGPRVQLFAGYRNVDLEVQNVTGIEDVDLFQMGARVRF